MADVKSKDATSKVKHEPTAKTGAKAKPPAGKPTAGLGAGHGAGLASARGGGIWPISREAASVLSIVLGLVIAIGFPVLIDRHKGEVADLRAAMVAEQHAIDEYPNAVAGLDVVQAERADAEARRDAARAEFEALDARKSESEARLAALDERLEAQGDALEAQIAALEGERGRLDGLVRATSEDLQAAMVLLETARGRISQ